MTLLLRNVRIPEVVRGDLKAQLAACHTGESGLRELVARYGADVIRTLCEQILDYTESLVRAELSRIPDGDYSFEDHIDDDGFDSGPIPIRVKLTVAEQLIIRRLHRNIRPSQVGAERHAVVHEIRRLHRAEVRDARRYSE